MHPSRAHAQAHHGVLRLVEGHGITNQFVRLRIMEFEV